VTPNQSARHSAIEASRRQESALDDDAHDSVLIVSAFRKMQDLAISERQ
jgi:hypothetical protein